MFTQYKIYKSIWLKIFIRQGKQVKKICANIDLNKQGNCIEALNVVEGEGQTLFLNFSKSFRRRILQLLKVWQIKNQFIYAFTI